MRVLVLVLLLAVAYAKHEQYIGWKTYVVTPDSTEQLKSVTALIPQFELDFLHYASIQRPGIVLVRPEHQAGFTKALEDAGVLYGIHADDVKELLDLEDKIIADRRDPFSRRGVKELPYDNFQSVDAIYEYLENVAARYPEKATLVNGGPTAEGRPIKYLKISTTNFSDLSKPVIFIDAGIHAREWISIPVATWAIRKLLEDVTEPDLLERFDWIIIPVLNPDGYEFSLNVNRFWRKNRSIDPQIPLSSTCPGVDGNRNYDFFFGTVGTSTNPCNDDYGGTRAFSEAETQLVRDLFFEHLDRIALYLSMHSAGSLILYPWGHNGTLSNNALTLHTVGIAMADAIYEHTITPWMRRYYVGNAVLALGYGASGASEDYAHWIGVPLSYTYELPHPWGVAVADSLYIPQIAEETWPGIVAGARRAGDLFRK